MKWIDSSICVSYKSSQDKNELWIESQVDNYDMRLFKEHYLKVVEDVVVHHKQSWHDDNKWQQYDMFYYIFGRFDVADSLFYHSEERKTKWTTAKNVRLFCTVVFLVQVHKIDFLLL